MFLTLPSMINDIRAQKGMLVLAASLLVTYHLWHSSERHALNEMELDFNFRVREAASRIEQRMAVHEQILHSVEGFMSHAKMHKPE